ncbi:hypothetical protein QYE76_031117 [Lolium multiflorum]|uniref:Uncharacterized protein n=1 Tax=Lolium multiflorum TaxID=4521 RepID=A0AAD8VI67_LOLMU|nr:hypothetical protein QYE76_031117 [Lolium multiflorum]
MIHMVVTPKDRAHIRSLKTAKEAWDKLDKLFLGNESIQSSRFDEVNNMADNFIMIEGESPEEMEGNGGRLVRKDKSKTFSKGFSKFSSKPGDTKVSFTKKPKAFIIREEYSSDEGGEQDDKSSNKEDEGVAAIAISTPSNSLFDSPNENLITNNAVALWKSLTIKREIVGLDAFLTNMQGDTKTHVEAFMAQLGAAQDLLEEKERLEREAANEIASLTQAHEEEQNLRMSLEASVITLEDSNNAIIPQLTKDRDMLSCALVGELKKEKLSLDVDHVKLLEELETLSKDYKSLERKFAILSKSSDQPQEEARKEKEVEGPNSCCDELVDQVASLRRHNALLLEVNSLKNKPWMSTIA